MSVIIPVVCFEPSRLHTPTGVHTTGKARFTLQNTY